MWSDKRIYKNKISLKAYVFTTLVYAIVSTLFFILGTAYHIPEPLPLLGEVNEFGDPRMISIFSNFIIGAAALITSLLLTGVYHPFRNSKENQKRGRLGGVLIAMGLFCMVLAEVRFSKNIVAQLIACGISIGCSLAAWRMFSHMQRAGTLTPSRSPDGEGHV